jgi:hypothetical protein
MIGPYAIAALVGKELVGIDAEDGFVRFVVLEANGDQVEYELRPMFQDAPSYITDIDGDMADLIDTPILEARYDSYMMRFIVVSALGTVAFSADGPDTEFGPC